MVRPRDHSAIVHDIAFFCGWAGGGESDMDLDLLAESESDSETSDQEEREDADAVSIQRSGITAATAGSDAGRLAAGSLL